MAEILDLQERRRRLTAKRGFENWIHRFNESFDENTCLQDISDSTLNQLIQGGEEYSLPLYELTMGVKGLGAGTHFHSLKNVDKMVVMDITLFLLDQLRFEALRRLGWIENYPTQRIPLLELVEEFSGRFAATKDQTPSLSPQHPRYTEYQKIFEGDRGRFIRKLIPDMIQAFKQRLLQ